MIITSDKFQAAFVMKNTKMKDSFSLKINQEVINSKNYVKLLGVEIDNKISFEKYISTLAKKLAKCHLQNPRVYEF